VPRGAQAQGDPNPGALTFTGGLDVPSTYLLRGIRQETDPGLTLWPWGDIGIALMSGDGSVKSLAVNFGTSNSLNTGSSGSDGPSGKLHYENDFYTTLSVGFGAGVSVTTGYTARTSPNFMFDTVKEFSVKVSAAHEWAPYGLLVFELGDDNATGADRGRPGTYLEFGVGPTWPLVPETVLLTVPLKLGLSLSDYYEHPLTAEDERFGFFDAGGLVTVPLKGIPERFGAWNVHAGANFLLLGDTTEQLTADADGVTSSHAFVVLFGVGVSY
jgi:hypothetical protein